ncbi:DUF5908 family protein [Pseudomonas kielensis]|uniref:DUF5908 family protein n=1 Tax=Pseudomonas kielensis TaxID=2762577 RepID=UPI00223F6D3E|nr:DUF5908 family protein [Pseudomonas kielensis]UZM16228.1 DUF5908 family protein [Pseudomonas kielensis]
MIEIHELVIQARVEDPPAAALRATDGPQMMGHTAEQDALIELIAQRVLARLRDEQGDWA